MVNEIKTPIDTKEISKLRKLVAPAAIALGVLAAGACTERTTASTPSAEVSTTVVEQDTKVEEQVNPEAKQQEVTSQLKELFDEVYSGGLRSDSIGLTPGEKIGDSEESYFEASAKFGDKKITVSMQGAGQELEPDSNNATSFMVRLSAAGGEVTTDNPEGDVTLAQVSMTKEPEGTAIVGYYDGGEFNTRGTNGFETAGQLDSAERAIDQISSFIKEQQTEPEPGITV